MIIVTGTRGFFVRSLIKQLLKKYNKKEILCLVYDIFDNDLEISGRLMLNNLGVKYIAVDLVTGRGLEKVPKSPCLVFHLASNTETGASDHRVNDIGTLNLINSISPISSNCKIIFTSTIAVSDHRPDLTLPANEDTLLLNPRTDYGRRKLIAENFLKDCAEKFKCSVTVVRLSAVFGKGTRSDGLFCSVSRIAYRNSFIGRLNYPGRLSFINVEDVAKILTKISKFKFPQGSFEIYIPISEVMTIAQLFRKYYIAYGIDYKVIKLPKFFWLLCEFITKFTFCFEAIFPRYFNNRNWQLNLLVSNSFYNKSMKIYKIFPLIKLKRIDKAINEMLI